MRRKGGRIQGFTRKPESEGQNKTTTGPFLLASSNSLRLSSSSLFPAYSIIISRTIHYFLGDFLVLEVVRQCLCGRFSGLLGDAHATDRQWLSTVFVYWIYGSHANKLIENKRLLLAPNCLVDDGAREMVVDEFISARQLYPLRVCMGG